MNILIYLLLGFLLVLALIATFLFGFNLGKKSMSMPTMKWTPLTTSVDTSQYNSLLDRGNYLEEKEIISDAFLMLLWGIENAEKGRHLASCDSHGDQVEEFVIDKFSIIRANANPIPHLERCFNLNIEDTGDD